VKVTERVFFWRPSSNGWVIHRWFGEDEEKSCIINLIDDATGKVISYMYKEETTYSAMTVLKRRMPARE